ncbi:hypothetical protein BCR34DRAFT_585815 [Clohesyomyces aquaticus]|uniref:Uncharacterized protein n=1 Tax=Clohesyomyces aquaticus TaxID=1231657 RepID=A0A1Y1ZW09_9PLEO|nr:hypothetical protein BCR34DRAFT_585815 [Clohesyomyces aquaticus]
MPHTTPPKSQVIDEVKANLPLPDQPPVASDWNSADARNVNVSAGGQASDISNSGLGSDSLRGPSTGDSAVRTDGEAWKTNTAANAGRQAHDGLDGIPSDAVTRDAKNKAGVTETTGKDYGYPQKNDPSSGLRQ